MAQPAAITTLFLDIGGVLLTNGWDAPMRASAAEKFGLDLAELNERHNLMSDACESGKMALDEYLDRAVFHQPRQFTREQFSDFMFAQSQPHQQMITLVRSLKDRHRLRLIAVNNESTELNQHRIHAFRLASFIDFFVSSCYVHLRKPDHDFYRLALDIAQVPLEQIVYIEDRALFVEAAASQGLRGIHHTNYESTRDQLAELGLKV